MELSTQFCYPDKISCVNPNLALDILRYENQQTLSIATNGIFHSQ